MKHIWGGGEVSLPNVSVCDDETNVVHYNPWHMPNNEIWYTSTDGNMVEPKYVTGFGATLVSNTYNNGKGVIKFDGNVTNIPSNAFSRINTISSISLPNSLITIGSGAFMASSAFTSVVIPENVTEIGLSAFLNSSVNTATVKSTTPPNITQTSFTPGKMTAIYVPSESVDAYKTAYFWIQFASKIQPIP